MSNVSIKSQSDREKLPERPATGTSSITTHWSNDATSVSADASWCSSNKEKSRSPTSDLLSRRLSRHDLPFRRFPGRHGSIVEEDGDNTISTRAHSTTSSLSGERNNTDGRTLSNRSLPPVIKNIHFKLHHNDEIRYVVVAVGMPFAELLQQISTKVETTRKIRLRTRDEDDDLITIGDQEDLDILISACKQRAEAQSLDTGKMEIWIDSVDMV